jgi:hypothetical protein
MVVTSSLSGKKMTWWLLGLQEKKIKIFKFLKTDLMATRFLSKTKQKNQLGSYQVSQNDLMVTKSPSGKINK